MRTKNTQREQVIVSIIIYSVFTCCTLLLWSTIGCLMLAKISSFLFSIVEAAEHTYDCTNKGYGSRHVWACLKFKLNGASSQ